MLPLSVRPLVIVTVAALLVCRSRLPSSVTLLSVPPALVPCSVVPLCTVALPKIPPASVTGAVSLSVVLTLRAPPESTMAVLLTRLLTVSVTAAECVMVTGDTTLIVTSSPAPGTALVFQLLGVFQLLSPAVPVHVTGDKSTIGSRRSRRG
jgi:hypothetical protein